jgi:hypothetical protein
VKNAPNKDGRGIIILEWKLEIHHVLENATKTMVKARKNIYGMRLESDNFDPVGGKLF